MLEGPRWREVLDDLLPDSGSDIAALVADWHAISFALALSACAAPQGQASRPSAEPGTGSESSTGVWPPSHARVLVVVRDPKGRLTESQKADLHEAIVEGMRESEALSPAAAASDEAPMFEFVFVVQTVEPTLVETRAEMCLPREGRLFGTIPMRLTSPDGTDALELLTFAAKRTGQKLASNAALVLTTMADAQSAKTDVLCSDR